MDEATARELLATLKAVKRDTNAIYKRLWSVSLLASIALVLLILAVGGGVLIGVLMVLVGGMAGGF